MDVTVVVCTFVLLSKLWSFFVWTSFPIFYLVPPLTHFTIIRLSIFEDVFLMLLVFPQCNLFFGCHLTHLFISLMSLRLLCLFCNILNCKKICDCIISHGICLCHMSFLLLGFNLRLYQFFLVPPVDDCFFFIVINVFYSIRFHSTFFLDFVYPFTCG